MTFLISMSHQGSSFYPFYSPPFFPIYSCFVHFSSLSYHQRSLEYILWLLLQCFYGILKCMNSGSLHIYVSCDFCWTRFYSLFCLLVYQFFLSYFILFVIPQKPVCFLMRDRKSMDPDWEWRECRETGKRNSNQDILCEERKIYFH